MGLWHARNYWWHACRGSFLWVDPDNTKSATAFGMLGSMAQSFFPLSTAPLLTRSQYWFVLVMAAYLCASAFGALAVPGTGLSYANVCFVFLLTTIGGSRSREDWGVAILLLALMVLDIIFRILLKDLSGLGYSVNIGRMAVFVLLAKQYWQLPCKIRLRLVFF